VRGIRWGTKFGQDGKLEDTLWSSLYDPFAGCAMAITAENLAEKYKITREECDAYGLRSQQTWAAAQDAGRFAAELTSVELKTRKGVTQFAADEHARRDASLESMAKLPTAFKKDGVVTAGNASGICDGAAALVIASEEAVKKHNLKPLARLVQWHAAGVDPTIMGIGPVPAIRGALARSGLELADLDFVEINEAFAAQYIACERELGLDRNKTNVDGGAIALGHPLGASGARITAHLVHELARRGGPGRQGGHMTVLHDYEITNVPGFGTLKAGETATPEQLQAALADTAQISFLRIKNSWGAYRPDRWNDAVIPGYHDLQLTYLNGPVKKCAEKDGVTDTKNCSDATPLWDVVLPAGY